MKKEFTCIICPSGCSLCAESENGIITVTGNKCVRGKAYGEEELVNPKRTLTTTVRLKDGRMLPVRSEKPIPKDKIFEAMEIINKVNKSLPVSLGEVIIEDVFGSKIISAKEVE